MKRTTAVAALSLILALGCSKKSGGGSSRVPVTIARAEQRPVPYELSGTGTVEPRQTASVQAQVTGILTRVAFREGGDPRPDRGTDRAAAGPGRQPGAGERGRSPRGDQPDPADPRTLRRAAEIPR